MRKRRRILDDLETLYREAFEGAQKEGDEAGMQELDFDFRREQLYLEILLDLRGQLVALRRELGAAAAGEEEKAQGAEALLERAAQLRRLTKLR